MTLNKKHILLAIKVIFIITALTIVLRKTDLSQIANYIANINILLLYISYLFILMAQITSAMRTRYYLKTEGVNLNYDYSVGLYFTGMLFNAILPGGIGGDGYKVYSINKLSKLPVLKTIKILISERASGLYVLLNFMALFAFLSGANNIVEYGTMIILLSVALLTPIYFICINIILKEKCSTALKALLYSIPVQVFGLIAVYFLVMGMGVESQNKIQIYGYIFLFSVSSVAAILPISIGGAGIRELAFLYGSKFLGLDPELGVAIAFVFFIINAFCSLKGLLFWHRLEKLYNKDKGVIDGCT
jgi:uncharacterized membrane protein YbhN (UPF0104 family)